MKVTSGNQSFSGTANANGFASSGVQPAAQRWSLNGWATNGGYDQRASGGMPDATEDGRQFQGASGRSMLSGNANVFTPSPLSDLMAGSQSDDPGVGPSVGPAGTSAAGAGFAGPWSFGSLYFDDGGVRPNPIQYHNRPAPIGTGRPNSSRSGSTSVASFGSRNDYRTRHGPAFTTDIDVRCQDGFSRYIAIRNIDQNDVNDGTVLRILSLNIFACYREHFVFYHGETSTLALRFDDVRDAQVAFDFVPELAKRYTAVKITAEQFFATRPDLVRGQIFSAYEGQVEVTVTEDHLDKGDEAAQNAVLVLAENFGPIRTIELLTRVPGVSYTFRMEFYRASSAEQLLDTLESFTKGFNSGERTLTFKPYLPSAIEGLSEDFVRNDSVGGIYDGSSLIGDVDGAIRYPAQYYQRGSGSYYFHKHDHGNAHNVIDIRKINRGQDVRTTIMLRNIPNKVTAAELKGMLDGRGGSFGCYDFMYLRIDFRNNCNVGYAFINFTSAQHIVPFVQRIGGRRWAAYNSDKVAEVSYATIQGRDCLVQKFRNSSVMEEWQGYRPKLFYAYPSPLQGFEEPFPKPDNMSKLKRSMDNAQTLGLFPPRGGSYRGGRARSSQYDSGNPRAGVESNTFSPSAHRRYSPQTPISPPGYPTGGFGSHSSAGSVAGPIGMRRLRHSNTFSY